MDTAVIDPLPPYLKRPAYDSPPLATLSLEFGGSRWVLKGDPSVTAYAKRLFPAATGHAGVAMFTANGRSFGDIILLMHRFPIAVDPASQPAWDRAYAKACEHGRRRDALHRRFAATDPALLAAARSSPSTAVRTSPGPLFRGTPRPYQEEGLAWLLANLRTLPADDMGLGKTVQAIMLLATLELWPALIVVPPHLVTQWAVMLATYLHTAVQGTAMGAMRPLTPTADLNAVLVLVFYDLLNGKAGKV
jgi:hypothetical protein